MSASSSHTNLLPSGCSPELVAYIEEVARDMRQARRSHTPMLTVSPFETTPELITEYGAEALQARVSGPNHSGPNRCLQLHACVRR